ncbi:MAG: M16 family metallopeptidase [Bacteroidota bacterium]|jgi:zinc protease|nr:insulinase family protein [Bacteroidia bacterium]MBP7728846.1 insulinase family protein [Bacteroidia bacterium]MBP7773182.1 insulinase family protein [Bacteroidia bacterium]
MNKRMLFRFIFHVVLMTGFPILAFGQEVIEIPDLQSNKVVIRLVFRNGSICDPPGKEGITDVTTSLIAEGGTQKLSSTEITRTIYPWAVRMYSSTDKETSTFSFEVLTKHLDQFYPIIRDLLLSPGFREDDFSRVISNQRNYVDEVIRQSSDEEYGKKYLEYKLFGGCPYAHLTAGTSYSLAELSLEDIKTHYKNYFTSGKLLIGLAGNYPASLKEQILNDFKSFNAHTPFCEVGDARTPEGLQLSIISKEGAMGSAISAGFPLNLTRSDDEFAALMVANSWLGEHRKSYSRLYQKIREARSMNYGDYTYIEWYENGGSNMLPPPGTPRSLNYFSIWLRPVQTAASLRKQYEELKDIQFGHAPFALKMAIREIDALIKNGMSQEDFEETREFLKSYTKLYAQTPARRLGYLMDSRFYGREDWLTTLQKLLSGLTLEDVNSVIRKFLQTQNMFVVIVTDPEEAKAINKALGSGSVTPVAYSDQMKKSLSVSILKEDNEVEAYPLKVNTIEIVNSLDTFRK